MQLASCHSHDSPWLVGSMPIYYNINYRSRHYVIRQWRCEVPVEEVDDAFHDEDLSLFADAEFLLDVYTVENHSKVSGE